MYYSKKIIERFLKPKNLGKIKNPSGVGDTQNIKCGDIMRLYLKIAKKGDKEYIKEIKFETMGCPFAITTSDLICDLVRGKSLKEASKISFKDIAKKIGPVPPTKSHCIHLAEKALKLAIKNYKCALPESAQL